MATFSIGAHEIGEPIPIDFGIMINTISGRSIISAADWGDDRVELGLSGDGMLRILQTPQRLHVNYVSTTNEGDIPPLMLQLIDSEKRQPARILELRLRALRTLYGIVHLSNTSRLLDFVKALRTDRQAEIDNYLLVDEQLFVECLAPGSWYVTVWSKLRTSYRSLLQTVAIVYSRGRDALLRKLEAEAKSKELDNEAKEFNLFASKVDFALALQDKVKDEDLKAILRSRVETELKNLLVSSNQNEIQNLSDKFIEKK